MRKVLTVVAIALAPFGPAACGGGGGGGSDMDQIRAIIDLGNSKNPALCDRLTDRWMQDVVGGSKTACEQQVQRSPLNAIQVQGISVNGDSATVTAQIEGRAAQLSLVKQDGEWKLDGIR